MRRWLILVMVLLLPLRGWAGDLMSVRMAMAGTAVAEVTAMPADCPMHAEMQAYDDSGVPTHADGGMPSCSSCELCIPMTEPGGGSLDAPTFAVHEQPLMPSRVFMSASLAPVVEPPIS